MPIDPSIALQVRSPEPVNLLAQYAQVAGIQNAGMQNKLAQFQLDEGMRKRDDEQALRADLSASGGDLAQVRNALIRRGQVKQALEIDAADRKRRLDEAGIDEKTVATALKRLEGFSGLIAPLTQDLQNLTHDKVLETGRRAQAMNLLQPGWESQIPMNAMELPAFVKSLALSTEQGRKSLEMLLPKVNLQDTGGAVTPFNTNPLAGAVGPLAGATPVAKTNTPGELLTDARTRAEGAANRGVQVRGQDMTDARSREQIASGRAPAGYRFKPDGSLEVIPGGPAETTKITEAQGKAGLYSSRASESDTILRDLEGKISVEGLAAKRGLEKMPGVGGVASSAANYALSANQQKVEQAQRDFVNAILRQESGAVISPSEFDNAQKQYFPQPGDGKEVIEQKRRNRETAIKGLKVMAGPAAPKGGASGGWKVEKE